jgi:hypothetical protein
VQVEGTRGARVGGAVEELVDLSRDREARSEDEEWKPRWSRRAWRRASGRRRRGGRARCAAQPPRLRCARTACRRSARYSCASILASDLLC